MKLGDVAIVRSSFTARGGVQGSTGGVLAIQQSDFTAEGFAGVEFLARTDEAVSRHVLTYGDILFRSRGQFTTAWVVPEEIKEPAIAVMPLFVIRPNRVKVNSHYLAWVLNQRASQQYFRQSSQGQTIQMISKSVLENVELRLPPLDRQEQIAKAATLAAQQQRLEARLLQCRHQLIDLQLQSAAQDSPNTAR
ncbi:restriction endonuclease subunit S [Arthrobacter sp. HY1533]|uniref:restriction endonuclease subunit S n=1 Tax=Arthrobacter sp. HY1533 TaxID=2970919 RepID=UPI0022B9F391|nr:restriction endonuclease subunit S [Arthrobacter sp. HY1533]